MLEAVAAVDQCLHPRWHIVSGVAEPALEGTHTRRQVCAFWGTVRCGPSARRTLDSDAS